MSCEKRFESNSIVERKSAKESKNRDFLIKKYISTYTYIKYKNILYLK